MSASSVKSASFASFRLGAVVPRPSFFAVQGCAWTTRPTTPTAPRLAVLQSGVVMRTGPQTRFRSASTRRRKPWVTPEQPWKCMSARPIFEPYRGHFRGQRGSRRCLDVTVPAEVPEWDITKRRTGLLARKAGMVTLYDKWGVQIGCTVLKVDNCQVVFNMQEKKETGTMHSIQVGCTDISARETKVRPGHFKNAGVPIKKFLAQFVVSPDAHIHVGTQLGATHFIPGQLVDLCGRTKAKGFQGVMKRWGFKGGPASHGSTRFHRKRGSSGHTGVGRVIQGTKMPGHMGDEKRSVRTVVVRIDAHLNIIYVKGNVFGPIGGVIRVQDSVRNGGKHVEVFPEGAVPPYPTMTVEEYKLLGFPREVQMGAGTRDPFNKEVSS